MGSPMGSPVMCPSPEYLYSPYPGGEYVAVPLEPPGPLEDEEEAEDGPSTADIIASQSQDYVDERLAEYQATIYQLQVESAGDKVVWGRLRRLGHTPTPTHRRPHTTSLRHRRSSIFIQS
ncbi:hypothetical protein J6590_025993 [Homalodisca vitripennis]|nr:hypothetical protein J6590_025993 [Homalodisca vitripennis]